MPLAGGEKKSAIKHTRLDAVWASKGVARSLEHKLLIRKNQHTKATYASQQISTQARFHTHDDKARHDKAEPERMKTI